MSDITTQSICDVFEAALRGPTRSEILEQALKAGDFGDAMGHLRENMRRHVFETASVRLEFDRIIGQLDSRTREEGFHVLRAWDHNEHRFSQEDIPVLMLDYAAREEGVPSERVTLAILLDYYFLHVLALVVMRAWDQPEADETFDRVTDMIGDLQGPYGSGHRFVDDAETLLVLAISHFHPDEKAYHRLIDRVQDLNEAHRTRFALASTPVLSSHLRWGFEVMYRHDVVKMRADNQGDYPWLFFAVSTLMREYVSIRRAGIDGTARTRVVEGLVSGIAPDPWAFAGRPPPSLSEYEDEYSSFLRLFSRYRDDLLEEFEAHRPSNDAYSPLGLHFNFPHNALVAMVTVALLAGSPEPLSLNALLMSEDTSGAGDEAREALARKLMEYSGSSPEKLDEHGAMLIVYDPYAGLASFTMALKTIKKHLV